MRPSGPWAALVVLASGCAAWPRHANLPAEGPLADGADYGVVDWVDVGGESEANDWPDDTGVAVVVLGRSAGLLASGALDGVGHASGTPEQRSEAGCAHAPARRYPLFDGRYTGDVDVVVVELDDAGVLCARATLDAPLAFDLLLLPLDDCDLPGPPRSDDAGPVGLDRGGASASWAVDVEPGRYAVQLAGWDPDDAGLSVGWTLSIALAADTCPAPPPEGA